MCYVAHLERLPPAIRFGELVASSRLANDEGQDSNEGTYRRKIDSRMHKEASSVIPMKGNRSGNASMFFRCRVDP